VALAPFDYHGGRCDGLAFSAWTSDAVRSLID
jgi:hypothetical protein